MASTSLHVDGEGFVLPAMAGGLCRFTVSSANHSVPSVMTTPLTIANANLASCLSPASGASGIWTVHVLQNGVTAEPPLYHDPLFSEYNLSAVTVSSFVPPSLVQVHSCKLTQMHACIRTCR